MTAVTDAKRELEPVAVGLIELARTNPFAGLQTFSDLLVPESELDEEAQPFPDLPEQVELTPVARAALNRLAKVFGGLSIRTRRALTGQELRALTDEAMTIADLEKVLAARLAEVKEIIRVHLDVEAEEAGVAVSKARRGVMATLRDRHGHYLLGREKVPKEIPVPGYKRGWKQSFVSGGAKTAPTPAELLKLYGDELVTRAEYLAVSREVRAFDPDRAMAFVRRNPERGLAILRALTKREGPGSALHMPER